MYSIDQTQNQIGKGLLNANYHDAKLPPVKLR